MAEMNNPDFCSQQDEHCLAEKRRWGGECVRESSAARRVQPPNHFPFSGWGMVRVLFFMNQKPHCQLPAHRIQSPVAGMWKDL